ncbi:hypothetical protein GXY_14148 [Novacetimonas hansenii ATCC 23769]|uniref:Uncharacterized protein n=1 Tax=Novacetimonas hansenii ATCC 23769 TaxID=714995 RepID=D5QI49_NOVHA|nr:hypothetical protein GXY_14148 [Novacetimonas hansenii ATCC 23769]
MQHHAREMTIIVGIIEVFAVYVVTTRPFIPAG